jgi:hypothetical protein
MYSGVRFRSRLEARWAAFFDLIEWPWHYEPYDLAGYIPDFISTFRAGDLLVEVKPALCLNALKPATVKVDRSGWSGEAIIVGARLDAEMHCLFGEVVHTPDGAGREWGDGQFFKCLNCRRYSVRSGFGSWRCRRCGIGDGNEHVADWNPEPQWLEAGNLVQWRAAG